MDRNPVVPDSGGVRGPGPAYLDIDAPFEDIEKVLEDGVGLGLVEAVDAASHGLVHEERFPSGDAESVERKLRR